MASGFSAMTGKPAFQAELRPVRDPVAAGADLHHVQPLGVEHLPGVVITARVHRQAGGMVERAGRLLGPGGGDRDERQAGDVLERRGVGLPVSRRADESEPHGRSSRSGDSGACEMNRLPAM